MTPRIHFITIVYQGMPFIAAHYPVFHNLPIEWEWSIIHGVAAPQHCTSWCAEIEPGLSTDGTTDYLHRIATDDDRIHLYEQPLWQGKVEMFNHALERMDKPWLLWQVDSDEVWTGKTIMRVAEIFAAGGNGPFNCADFICRYFVGPGIITTTLDAYGNNRSYEWRRVWRWKPGMRFATHEPPRFEGHEPNPITHADTMRRNLSFDHFSWVTEEQVRFKCRYYNSPRNPKGHLYADGVAGWRRLQANQQWPAKLQQFLPWVDDRVEVKRIIK